ncbi:hypothetical protein Pmani_016128 [Petrolisthes manimaculis]|uniref:Uncharacterized protein n=1 Tax=Petrolisthes manimaculis TaxID=1843537 RepID=A0AAE1PPN7_9EUCA|nr:hypothetical protein Pmani_016128 [Petrolisthes manimaculis]
MVVEGLDGESGGGGKRKRVWWWCWVERVVEGEKERESGGGGGEEGEKMEVEGKCWREREGVEEVEEERKPRGDNNKEFCHYLYRILPRGNNNT